MLSRSILIFTPTKIVAQRLRIQKEVTLSDQDYFGLPIYDGTQYEALVVEADLSPNRVSSIDRYDAEKHLPQIAFLMGIMGKGYIGFKSVFRPNESVAKEIYYHHAFDLAKRFGLTQLDELSDSTVTEWEPKLLEILKQLVIDGIYSIQNEIDKNQTYAKSFLTGSYCRYGEAREIGFVATLRAEFMIELLFILREPYRITHLERGSAPGGHLERGSAPGGSSVTLTEETIFGTPVSDNIISSAQDEIAAIKTDVRSTDSQIDK